MTAAFLGKGKCRPLQLMEKTSAHAETFAQLGKEKNLSQNVQSGLEFFVCCLYGKPNLKHIDSVRFSLFQQKYATKRNENPLSKIKGTNPSNMPPCKNVLEFKMKRSNFITYLWKRASLPHPINEVDPTEHGWKLVNGKYELEWFTCEQVPGSITDILATEIGEVYLEDEDEQCVESDDSDDDWE